MFHHYHHIQESGFMGLSAAAWAAIATFLAVLVALFQEWIKTYFNKAVLKVEIISSPPDMHKIAISTTRGVMPSLYIRIRVTNESDKVAEGVEIMATNFWTIAEDGKRIKLPTFLPLNLKWSHSTPPLANIRIPAGLFRFCDFGSIRPQILADASGDRCVLLVDTIVQPNPVADGVLPNMFGPEKYEFELTITGDNVNATTKRWYLEFDNFWSNNEDEMLQHIRIEEIK